MNQARRRPFDLIREYPYTMTALLFLLGMLVIVSAVNFAVAARNTDVVNSLRKTQAAQQLQADTDRKTSAAFISTFLGAQLAECEAVLDADARLGADAIDPRVCVVALPAPSGKP